MSLIHGYSCLSQWTNNSKTQKLKNLRKELVRPRRPFLTYNGHEYLFMVDYMPLFMLHSGHIAEPRRGNRTSFSRSVTLQGSVTRFCRSKGLHLCLGSVAPPGLSQQLRCVGGRIVEYWYLECGLERSVSSRKRRLCEKFYSKQTTYYTFLWWKDQNAHSLPQLLHPAVWVECAAVRPRQSSLFLLPQKILFKIDYILHLFVVKRIKYPSKGPPRIKNLKLFFLTFFIFSADNQYYMNPILRSFIVLFCSAKRPLCH